MASDRILVVHVIHHFVIGGMENGVVNLVNNLDSERYEHVIVCIENYSDFRNRIGQDITVIPMFRSKIGVWKLRKKLFELFRKIRPDIVHTRNLSALDAVIPAKLAGVKHCVHGEHGFDIDDISWRNRKMRFLRKIHRPFIQNYIAVSRHIRDYLMTVVKCREEKVLQIYNGVDTKRFSLGVNNAKARFPITYGTVGRLQRVKDQLTLIHAYSRMLKRYPEFRENTSLVIYGDGPMKQELNSLVADLGIQKYVDMKGAIQDATRAYEDIDVFVLPSLMEGISNTILEAMSSGLPVVATSVGGNTELVTHGGTGYLFEPGNVQQLSNFMVSYAKDIESIEDHGFQGRTRAEQDFDLSCMVREYDQIYTRLVNIQG